MVLLGLFAALALGLAAIGIHGVLSCTVAQRNREIGIRMALGANASRVVRAVVAQGIGLTAIGLILGLALAVGFARFIAGLLFGIAPTDVMTFASVVLVLAAVAALSVWLPARRAVSIDPVVALKADS
jgi:ABC-type antimicrobial peptide transport system permease subunit